MSANENATITTTTIPVYATPTLATEILNKQQTIINNLEKALIDSSNVLMIDVNKNNPTTLTSNTNPQQTSINRFTNLKEPFTNQMYLPKSNVPEIKDYVNVYNENIALMDNPQDINKTQFETYLYLQNKKINELQNAINTFPTNKNVMNKPINAIKNLNTSTLLNVQEYQKPDENKKIYSNGSSIYPNYLIYGNNGCLQYNTATSNITNNVNNNVNNNINNNGVNTWEFKSCDSNNQKQRFLIKQINTLNDYNEKITHPDNETSKLLDTKTTMMGFYVVNPEIDANQCITLNSDGLSVMPCTMEPSQRFKPYYHTVLP